MSDQYTIADFTKEVIEESFTKPVLVDFWAEWCGPCLMLAPILEELAEENAGKWKLAKVNTDERQELAQQYKIMGIPALRLFHKGEIIAQFNGLMYKPQMGRWIDENLPQ